MHAWDFKWTQSEFAAHLVSGGQVVFAERGLPPAAEDELEAEGREREAVEDEVSVVHMLQLT